MTTSEIFNFTEKPVIDESIQEYEFHEYEPQARSNLNSAGEISINIELQDLFTHPCESYLIFEGRLTKQDGTAYANANAVSLTNNGIMYICLVTFRTVCLTTKSKLFITQDKQLRCLAY